MDDLISRQAAIEAVSEGCQEWRGIFERCKEKLLSLPSAQLDYDLSGYSDKLWKAAYERGKAEEQPEQRWIPVAEGLPGYGEKVLCCVDGRIYIDERNLRGWRYRVTEYDAWMPLPEPWKGEEDE